MCKIGPAFLSAAALNALIGVKSQAVSPQRTKG
jgi:hypothetical protein